MAKVSLSSEGAAAHFREYMNNFEIDSLLRAEFEVAALATPMIYLPVTRSANAFQSSVQLWLSIRSFSLRADIPKKSARAFRSSQIQLLERLLLYAHVCTPTFT